MWNWPVRLQRLVDWHSLTLTSLLRKSNYENLWRLVDPRRVFVDRRSQRRRRPGRWASKDGKKAEAKKDEKPDEKKDDLKDKVSVTKHTAKIHGKEIKYTATAGKLVMKDDEGKPKALVFFIAYTKNGVDDLSQRPISFAFNGGPGSSSVWLHLGMLGPRRVKVPDDATQTAPPYSLTDNPLLAVGYYGSGVYRPREHRV